MDPLHRASACRSLKWGLTSIGSSPIPHMPPCWHFGSSPSECCCLETWQIFKKRRLCPNRPWLQIRDEPYLCSRKCYCYPVTRIRIKFVEIYDWSIGTLEIQVLKHFNWYKESVSNRSFWCILFHPMKQFRRCTCEQRTTTIFTTSLWVFFEAHLYSFVPSGKIWLQIYVMRSA